MNKGKLYQLLIGFPVLTKDNNRKIVNINESGEKLYEELLIDPAQSQPTRHPRIFSSEEPLPESEILQKEIQLLSEAISKRDLNSALESMKRLVPEYNPENGQ